MLFLSHWYALICILFFVVVAYIYIDQAFSLPNNVNALDFMNQISSSLSIFQSKGVTTKKINYKRYVFIRLMAQIIGGSHELKVPLSSDF